MDSSSELRPGDVVAGRYVIEALLGESPAARLFLADENHSRQKLCLKVYRPEISSQLLASGDFFQRAGMLPALAHDNLAAVYDVQEWDERIFLAREFLEGPSFEEWAKSDESSPGRGLELLWQAAQSLGFLHEKGCHLNLHPGNLLLAGFSAKLADPDPRLLTAGDSIPFPLPVRPEFRGYTAPEMRRSGAIPRPACDLYGLAGMFFRLLAGAHPAESPAELTRRINALPAAAAAFLAKALHFDPDARYQSAEDFADALWALQPAMQSPEPISAKPAKGGTVFDGDLTAARKTEYFPNPEFPSTSSGTLFGATASASFADPETPKQKPAPVAKASPAPPPPPSPPVRKPLTSLESDSPDLTLSGGASEGLTQYGFKNAGSSQTLAMVAEKKRKSRKVLWISIAAAGVALTCFAALFLLLKSSAKQPVEEARALPSQPSSESQPPAPANSETNPATETAAETPTENSVIAAAPTDSAPFPEAENVAPQAAPVAQPPAPEPKPEAKPEAKTPPKKKSPPSRTAPKPKPSRPTVASVPKKKTPSVPAAPAKPTQEELVGLVKAQNWPGTTEERLKLGDDLNDYGRVAEANQAYSKAMELPGMVPKERVHALGGLAVTFNKMGLRDEALNALDQLLALQPTNKFAKDLKAQMTR